MMKFNYCIAKHGEIRQGYKRIALYNGSSQSSSITNRKHNWLKRNQIKYNVLRMETLPNECPVCNKETKNVLLHIKKKKSCNSKIDPVLYDHWKEEAKKKKKRSMLMLESIRKIKQNMSNLENTREFKPNMFKLEGIKKPNQNMLALASMQRHKLTMKESSYFIQENKRNMIEEQVIY